MGTKLEKIEVSQVELENQGPDILPLEPGTQGYMDPVALEKQLVAEEQARLNADPDQEELACMMLKIYTPRFNNLIDQLSNRQLRRVIKSLVEFPLGKDYNHKDKTEAEAFMVGQGLLDAKMVLVIKTYNDHKDEILEGAAREAAKNVTLEFGDKAEVTNEEKEITNG